MIKQMLLTGWNFMRILRLALGLTIAIQSFQSHDILLGMMSAFLLFQSITNTGCCGTKSCNITEVKDPSGKIEDVDFEEVK